MFKFSVKIKTAMGTCTYTESHFNSVDVVTRALSMFPYALTISVIRL